MKMIDIIKKFDNFGTNISLTMNKSHNYKTTMGGLINIIIYILLGVACYLFGKELWEKRNPSTNTSTIINPTPRIQEYHKDFEFNIGVRNKQTLAYFIDPSIYSVVSIFYVYDAEAAQFNTFYLNMEECTQDSFDPNHVKLFDSFPYHHYWCISKNQTTDVKLEKLYGQNNFKMITTNVIPCQNSSSFDKCASQEKIDSILDGTYITINAISSVSQPGNYSFPFQIILEDYFSSISNLFTTDMTIYLKEVEFRSDDGIFTESWQNMFGFETEAPLMNFLNKDYYMFSLTFELSDRKDLIVRYYYKLQNLFAQIGGLFNFCNVSFVLLFRFYNKFCFYREIIDKIYSKEVKRHSEILNIKHFEILKLKQNIPIKRHHNNDKITLFQYISSKFRKNNIELNNKIKKYLEMRSDIENKVEITSYLKIFNDIEK